MSHKVKVKVKLLSRVGLFVTSWTVAYQASTSMGFSRQEYWSGLPFPSPGDLPYSGIEPRSPTLEADALTSESLGKPIYELDSPIILFSMFSFGYQGYANLIKRDRVTLCYCSVKFALPEMIFSLKL